MKFIRYIVFLFYSYYSNGSRRNVAYLSSILGTTFLFFIQLLILVVALDIDKVIPIGSTDDKSARYLKILLLMSPIFFLLFFSVKEKKIEELQENLEQRGYDNEILHRVLLFTYLFTSLAVLIGLAFWRK